MNNLFIFVNKFLELDESEELDELYLDDAKSSFLSVKNLASDPSNDSTSEDSCIRLNTIELHHVYNHAFL